MQSICHLLWTTGGREQAYICAHFQKHTICNYRDKCHRSTDISKLGRHTIMQSVNIEHTKPANQHIKDITVSSTMRIKFNTIITLKPKLKPHYIYSVYIYIYISQ